MYLDEVKDLERFIERGEKQLDALTGMIAEIDQIRDDLAKSIERARMDVGVFYSGRIIPEPMPVKFLSIESAE